MEVIFYIAAAIAVIAFSLASAAVCLMGGAAVGVVWSFVSYIRSLFENVNPYKTYVDKSKRAQEGVRRNYFFGPGYHQIAMTVKGAWAHCTSFLGSVKSWSSYHSGGFFSSMWCGTIYVAILLSVGALGAIWTAVFSVLHSVIVFAFMCAFYLLFTALWLLDRTILLVNSIGQNCPVCKRQSVIPVFVCPNCGRKHTRLVPGPYGIFYRRCACGEFLPTTFLNGRSRLHALCQHCDAEFSASNATQFGLQLVGGVSAGKTTYLAAFQHLYLEMASRNPNLHILLDPARDFNELEGWFRHGESSATSANNANMYSFIHTLRNSKISHQFSIYDIAGETFAEQTAMIQQEQYRYCKGILFIIDPFSVAKVRNQYQAAKGGRAPSNYSSSDPEEVANGFIGEFARISYSDVGKISDIPVSVLITKADVDIVNREIGYPAITAIFNRNAAMFNYEYSQARDAVCRNYLQNIGLGSVLNHLSAQFNCIHLFPVSAMGHEAQRTVSYRPWGIMEPVAWIVRQQDSRLADMLGF